MKVKEIQSALLPNTEILTHILDLRSRSTANREFTRETVKTRDDGSTYRTPAGKLRELNLVTAAVVKHFHHADSPLQEQAEREEKEFRELNARRRREERRRNGGNANGGGDGDAMDMDGDGDMKANPEGPEAQRSPPPSLRSPSPPPDGSIRSEEGRRTLELLERLRPFKLTKPELLMIVNHRPRSETVLEVLIEECEARLSAEKQAEILRIVREVYGLPEPEEEEEEEAAEGGAEEDGVDGMQG